MGYWIVTAGKLMWILSKGKLIKWREIISFMLKMSKCHEDGKMIKLKNDCGGINE